MGKNTTKDLVAIQFMETKRLGRTDLEVTRLGYGAMELRNTHFRDGRIFTPKDAELILNKVLDGGINFIDTSYDYPHSEEYIGKFISHRRNEFYLTSKCGCTDLPGENGYHVHVWTRQNLLVNIENSLRRLKTDYLDLWQLHNPSLADVAANDLIAVMQEVQAAGKVRFIGVSIKIPHAHGFIETGEFDTLQMPYSAMETSHEEILRQAAAAGIGTIVRGGVSQGSALNTRQQVIDKWTKWEKAGLDDFLLPGQSRPQFLISYLLANAAVDTMLVGTISPEHLQSNIAAFAYGALPQATYDQVRSRLADAARCT
jgi:aryl-alcohol dehydrogenase-like predicted oxidoreductase